MGHGSDGGSAAEKGRGGQGGPQFGVSKGCYSTWGGLPPEKGRLSRTKWVMGPGGGGSIATALGKSGGLILGLARCCRQLGLGGSGAAGR